MPRPEYETNITHEMTDLERDFLARMKERGIELIPIPQGFYDDLPNKLPRAAPVSEDIREEIARAIRLLWSKPFNEEYEDYELADALMPLVARIQAGALLEAADEFDARLPDGTSNGRAYNSYTVARMLRARADRQENPT